MSEYARRVMGGRIDVVSISELLRDGVDPRRHNYLCVDKKCDVPVFPAIPEKVKPGRRRSPSPYFRAGQSEPHQDGCLRGAIEERIKSSGGEEPALRTGAGEERARTGEAPVRFVESPPARNGAGGGNQPNGAGPGEPGSHGRPRHGTGVGVSQASANSIERFANAYENPPVPHSQMSIAIKDCPARTFAETFISPVEGDRVYLDRGVRHIFRGGYGRHEHWKTGVSVYFQETANGLPLSVWIPNDLQPTSVLNRLFDRLQEAEYAHEAMIYVLGKFVHKPNHGKYAIELWSPYQCWIHIPSP